MKNLFNIALLLGLTACSGLGDGYTPSDNNDRDGGIGPPPPVCEDGEKRTCYQPGTESLGVCAAGFQTCTNNAWGDCEVVTLSVNGTWTLRGSGKRSRCDDPHLNTELFTLQSDPLRISHTSSTTFELDRVDPDLSFRGSMQVRCVSFRTTEQTQLGEVTFDWSGRIDENFTIRGDFQGDGPGRCQSVGDFTVDIN